MSTIDNVVRPWAMKGKAQLPAIPLLFAVLGGLQTFGFVGLVIGPLVFSLLKSILDIYKECSRRRRLTRPRTMPSPRERSYYPAAARGPVESTLHGQAQTG